MPWPADLLYTLQPGNDDSEGSESDTFLTSAMEEVESGKAEEGVPFSSEKFESALTDAFNRTDEEFGKADNAALVGTTAVVALVGSRQLYVANCGTHRPASTPSIRCFLYCGFFALHDPKPTAARLPLRPVMGGQIALWWPVHACSHAHHRCHEDSSFGDFACCTDSVSSALCMAMHTALCGR